MIAFAKSNSLSRPKTPDQPPRSCDEIILGENGSQPHAHLLSDRTYRISLRNLSVNERPQERLERLGASSLSDTELLAMILRKGTSDLDVINLASEMIQAAGSLAGCTRFTAEDFKKFRGVGTVKSLQLLAVMEVARRVLTEESGKLPILDEPVKVAEFMRPRIVGLTVEKFWVLSLNTKNRLIQASEISSGTANASLVHPREVFREAIRQSATAVICVHNHPSGDPAPSSADIKVTKVLRSSAETIQIQLVDHIIVGSRERDPCASGYFSFSERGIL